MPTKGRHQFAMQAVESFLSQLYPWKELIIVDDMQEPSFLEPLRDPQIHYYREFATAGLGLKRNRCCHLANGSIICHWDDDDWSSPQRMGDQVCRLEDTLKQVTGYRTMLFYDPLNEPHWGRYAEQADYALGTSLCYWKSWWEQNPFIDIPFGNRLCVGEDNDFIYRAQQAGQFICSDGLGIMVARIHTGCTSPKNITDYRPVDSRMIPAGFMKYAKRATIRSDHLPETKD